MLIYLIGQEKQNKNLVNLDQIIIILIVIIAYVRLGFQRIPHLQFFEVIQ